jgi:hypothetical protein
VSENALLIASRGNRRPPIPSSAAWLGGAGLIPFVALAAGVAAAGPPAQAIFLDWLVRYGAVIVTFVGALHWGVSMRSPGARPDDERLHLAWSVVPALGAWIALALPPGAALCVLIGLFAVQLVMDRWLASTHDLVPWFIPLRIRLTLAAIASLATALAAMLAASTA